MPFEFHQEEKHVIVDEYAAIEAQIKALSTRKAELKKAISKAMGSANELTGNNFTAVQTLGMREGSLDPSLLEQAGIDANQYRKPDTSVYTLKIMSA